MIADIISEPIAKGREQNSSLPTWQGGIKGETSFHAVALPYKA
jgi:hypothetical protein